MKKIKYLSILLLSVFALPIMVSCGGSDDDDNGGGGNSGPTSDKLLVKETIQRENKSTTYEYSYDSQGRVIRKDIKENGNSGGYYVYTYIDNLIVQKHYFAVSESMETKYTLENGLIVSEEVNGTIKNRYTYENSYLVTRNNTGGGYKYIWNNGNLTSIKWQSEWQPDENATSKGGKNYEYTSYAAPQGFVIDIYVEEDLGKFFGKSSKNLPSKFTEVNNDGEISEQITYDWTLKDGLPVKLVVMEKDGGGIYTTIHTYEWQ